MSSNTGNPRQPTRSIGATEPDSLLDGATPQSPVLSAEVTPAAAVASNHEADLDERLEAFEDVILVELVESLKRLSLDEIHQNRY